ncbi:hypothetical protein GCM10009682_43660 [Luedemannella flava]|uniref:Peptidase S8/S53 domain-containing protein n=1 Tax=Luedemannella flava TaxID=349316 RepID=A0ABP4YJ60_9ACTN
MTRLALWCAAALLAALLPVTPAAAAVTCAKPGTTYAQKPWAEQLLGTERVAPFARGAGVTVAVLDTGVDRRHPQLAGHVDAGYNAVTRKNGADSDCLGRGTALAGIIAAQAAGGTGVAGVAPGATIMPVKVIDDSGYSVVPADPVVLARGVDWAATHGAGVIVIPTAVYTDRKELREAVARALDASVLVVAAVGDLGDDDNRTPYPASYEGVLGVGAIAPNAEVWGKSQHGTYVDVVAPGVELVTLAPGKGHLVGATGTGFAAAYVGATAALVRAKRDLPVSAVSRLLQATATPAAGAAYYGHGLINPYAATTEELAPGPAAALPGMAVPPPADGGPWARSREIALWGTAIAAVGAFLALVLGMTLPRGRRRRWRAAEAAPPHESATDLEPSGPVLLFEER